jgi:hypothetical protein
MKNLRVLIAGGGTGCHIIPALAVARRVPQVLLLGPGIHKFHGAQAPSAWTASPLQIITASWRTIFTAWDGQG